MLVAEKEAEGEKETMNISELKALRATIKYEDVIRLAILEELDGYEISDEDEEYWVGRIYSEYLKRDDVHDPINFANSVGYVLANEELTEPDEIIGRAFDWLDW